MSSQCKLCHWFAICCLKNKLRFPQHGTPFPSEVYMCAIKICVCVVWVCELGELRDGEHVLNQIISASGPPQHRSCSSSSTNPLICCSLLLSLPYLWPNSLIHIHVWPSEKRGTFYPLNLTKSFAPQLYLCLTEGEWKMAHSKINCFVHTLAL